MSFFVLLTVPHYTCSTSGQHSCDIKAEFLADSISERLSQRNIRTKVLLGGISRGKIDLNRVESRHTNFRRRIRTLIREAEEKVILLDCHSFDETHTFYEKHRDPDFVLLTDNLEKFKVQVLRLREMLEQRDIKTNVIVGLHNDIIDEFEKEPKVLIPILLEVSEAVKCHQMHNISDTIKNWVEELIEQWK